MAADVTLFYYLCGLVIGLVIGASVAVAVIYRWFPRVTVQQVVVTPEAIARGIVAGGGIHCTTPAVLVDWNIIHQVVEANGYQLIAKREPGAPKRH